MHYYLDRLVARVCVGERETAWWNIDILTCVKQEQPKHSIQHEYKKCREKFLNATGCPWSTTIHSMTIQNLKKALMTPKVTAIVVP